MPLMFRPSPLPSIRASLLPLLLLSCTAARTEAPNNAPANLSGPVPSALAAFPSVGTPAPVPSDIRFVSLEGPFWVAAKNRLLSSSGSIGLPPLTILPFDATSSRSEGTA